MAAALNEEKRAKERARQKAWRDANPELVAARRRRYVQNNLPAHAARAKRRRQRMAVEEPSRLLHKMAKKNAREKGLAFEIAPTDLPVPTTCPVLGIALSFTPGKRTWATPSVDRVDPAQGYIPGNVRVISWRANRLKWDSTLAELEAVVRYMREHRETRP